MFKIILCIQFEIGDREVVLQSKLKNNYNWISKFYPEIFAF